MILARKPYIFHRILFRCIWSKSHQADDELLFCKPLIYFCQELFQLLVSMISGTIP